MYTRAYARVPFYTIPNKKSVVVVVDEGEGGGGIPVPSSHAYY